MIRFITVAAAVVCSTAVLAQAPVPPTDEDKRRLSALDPIMQQRNEALNGLAVCIGDSKALQGALTKAIQDLAEARKKIEDFEKKPAAK